MKSINALIQNIREHPEEWEFTSYRANNTKRGIEIWISGGFWFCVICSVGEHETNSLSQWNLVDKWKVWHELKKLPDYLVLKALTKDEEK